MRARGFDKPLYILPFDHRGSFQTKMFGWKGALTPEQTAEIAAAKQVVYDGFKAAVEDGVPERKAGILTDEQRNQIHPARSSRRSRRWCSDAAQRRGGSRSRTVRSSCAFSAGTSSSNMNRGPDWPCR